MTTHTAERITRSGHRQITTESGKPLFEAFSGAVGPAEADANEERLLTVWNSHDQVVAALLVARSTLAGMRPIYKDRMGQIDAALAAAGIEP